MVRKGGGEKKKRAPLGWGKNVNSLRALHGGDVSVTGGAVAEEETYTKNEKKGGKPSKKERSANNLVLQS